MGRLRLMVREIEVKDGGDLGRMRVLEGEIQI